MPLNDFDSAIRELQDAVLDAAKVTIRYRRDSKTSLQINAGRGESKFERTDWQGIVIEILQIEDFLIRAKDLQTIGFADEPRPGDTILMLMPDGVTEERFEVFPTTDNRTYRYTDHTHEVLRVHTKRVSHQ